MNSSYYRKNNRISAYELLYMISFILYAVYRILLNSLISSPDSMKYLVLLGLMGSLVIRRRLNVKSVLFLFVLFLGGMAAAMTSARVTQVLMIVLFVAGGRDIHFKRLLRVELTVLLILYGLISLCGAAGILDDRIYYHVLSDSTAHTLGFIYYGFPAGVLTILSCIYIYLKKRTVGLQGLILFAAVGFVSIMVYTARLYASLLVLYVLLCFAVENYHVLDLSRKHYKFFAAAAYPTALIFSLIIVKGYNINNPVLKWMNILLAGRVGVANRVLGQYGIGLLGNRIESHTMADRVYGGYTGAITMVDFGFINIVLNYGILFSVLLVIVYSAVFVYVWQCKDKKLYCWMLVSVMMCIINNNLMELLFNPFLILLGNKLAADKNENISHEPRIT